MSWVPTVFANLFKSTTAFTTEEVKNQLKEFGTFLNGGKNPLVRFWVEAGASYGHQASTSNLIYRIARPVDEQELLNFAYTGTIEIYYENDDELAKLKQLIPELNLQTPKINNATLTPIKYDSKPVANANLGFTGGANAIKDYATTLNVNYFLRLQPFNWAGPEEIQRPGQAAIDLTTVRELGSSFKQRVFYVDPMEYQTPPSVSFPTNMNGKIVDLLTSDAVLKDYQLLVTYSIKSGISRLNPNPVFGAALVCGSVLSWQTNQGKSYKNAKPAVILNFDDFGSPDNSEADDLGTVLAGGISTTENGLQVMVSAKETPKNAATKRNYERRQAFFQSLNSGERFSYLNYPTTTQAVQNALDTIAGQKDKVLFVQLGRSPAAIFRYAVSKSTLPALFEGQGTANLAINIGRAYMQVPAPNMSVLQRLQIYPNVTLTKYTSQHVPENLVQIAGQISTDPATWPERQNDAPCVIVGDYYRQYTDEKSDEDTIRAYFANLRLAFASPDKDKFTLALSYLNTLIPKTTTESALEIATAGALQVTAEPADNPLNALYTELQAAVTIGQPLNLIPGILTKGVIPAYIQDFLQSYAPGLTLTVAVFEHEGEPPDVTKITLDGPTTAFESIGVKCDVNVVFTTQNGELLADVTFADKETWTMPEVPWIVFRDAYISMLVPDGKLPITATFGGYYPALESKQPPITAKVEISVGSQDLWPATITFQDNYPSISNAFQMAASINLVQRLPPPFNVLTDLGVSEVELQYDFATKVLNSILITAQSNTPNLRLFGDLFLNNIKISTILLNPTTTSELSVSGSAEFNIGPLDKDHAVISVSFSYPGLTLLGQLKSGVITLPNLLSTFLPGVELTLPQLPTIDEFNFSYNRTTDYLVISLNFNIQWTFTFFGEDLFIIENVGFGITRNKAINTGFITGNTILLPKTAKVGVYVGAFYEGNGAWRFVAQQTSGVFDLNALLVEYLGPQWNPPIQFPQIDGLSVTMNWLKNTTTAFEFNAKTATDWYPIPELKDVKASGKLKFGYNSQAAAQTAGGPPVAATAIAPLAATPGKYGELSAKITIWKIELDVAYNFNPDSQKLCIQWLFAKACIETDKTTGDTIATFTLDDKSIGEMVEIFVSWAMGAKFGLVAPWNILNDIKLNGLKVTYNFTKKKVSFTVGIGPIDLGLFKLNGISLKYDPDNPTRKVEIAIDGSFAWTNDSNLNWDPTKPETTPAPPGGGNKYLDLRLLALGQHVTVAGLTEETQVEGVIKKLREMTVPNPPDIPVGGAGQPVFAPRTSWFVALDFGVLKAEEKKNGGAAALLADGSSQEPNPSALARRTDLLAVEEDPKPPVYFIQLSIVFNDPILYALRIALDGPMAKVFAGLDFQIMYRQVSDTVGCYSAMIALPNIMRKFQVGIATITLPIFSIQVYTNGDFQVDIGFPWNQDFSRSFTIEAIIPPGIPVMGSAGFYFGKLSSATTDKVPKTTTGWFNPVIVFGFGAQIGLGKSIEAGILRAGFSLTVFGIIEGVLARWLPYQGPTEEGRKDQLQDGFFFSLTGTFGIQGRLYGTVDFAIIKADVDVAINIYARITFVAYEDILISASASVRIKVSLKIDLGLFSITISFSFSATVEASFVLQNPMPGPPPWASTKAITASAQALHTRRLNKLRGHHNVQFKALAGEIGYAPKWDNLLRGPTLQLQGWVMPVLTVAGDIAKTPAEQSICYVTNFFLNTPPPVQTIDSQVAAAEDAQAEDVRASDAHLVEKGSVAHAALARARRLTAAQAQAKDETESSATFEDLSVRVLQWVIAAGLSSPPLTPADVNAKVVTDEFLAEALAYLSGATTPTPIPAPAIEVFLKEQTQFLFTLNTDKGSSPGVFFPAPPGTSLNVPDYGTWKGYQYTFGQYNSSSSNYLDNLNTYFNQLKVQVQEEQAAQPQTLDASLTDDGPSIASYIFGDYFALIGRQAIQALRDGLRNFKLVIESDQTIEQVVKGINDTGDLPEDHKFSAGELFVANDKHLLNSKASGPLTIAGMTWVAPGGKSFTDIAKESLFGGGFDGKALAQRNADNATIIAPGVKVSYSGQDYLTQNADSLDSIAAYFKITLEQLLSGTDVLVNPTLIAPLAILFVPDFSYAIVAGDTLSGVTGRFGIDLDRLADANTGIKNLFDTASDPNLNIPNLVQYEVGALIDECHRTLALQNLSAMTSRFYLYGLRLPTDGLKANARGLFVSGSAPNFEYPDNMGLFALTGQAFPLPLDIQNSGTNPKFNFTLTRGSNEGWLNFGATGGASLTYTLSLNEDYQRYTYLRDFALKNQLDTGLSPLEAVPAAKTQASRFPLSQEIPWQLQNSVPLPRQTITPPTPNPRLWPLPDSLINMPLATDPRPRLKPVVARTDEATGSTVDEKVSNYGFGTLITFSLRKAVPIAGSPSTEQLYELVGATERDIVLLERLLDQLAGSDSQFQQMALLYRPASTSSETNGWQSDNQATSLMGISQVNLSTETRPPTQLQAADFVLAATADLSNVINKPTEFLRLLWEASITRQGGFYLSYMTAIGSSGGVKGLPDYIFDDRNTAEVSVLSLFKIDAGDGQLVSNYMNVAATNEQFDLSNGALIAVGIPTELNTPGLTPDATLSGLAVAYYTDPALIAERNADKPLTSAISVTINGGFYEVPPSGIAPGGKLSDIATYFNTTVDSIKKANPNRTDWPDPLPLYTGLILPQIVVKIGSSNGGNTFGSLSRYYNAPIPQIAAANKDLPGIFPEKTTLTILAGPVSLAPAIQAGVAGFTASRTAPATVPVVPSSDWAKPYLLQLFNLLGYRVAANADFKGSWWGLPGGPADPDGDTAGDTILAPEAPAAGDLWIYTRTAPYPKLVANPPAPSADNLPDQKDSPYLGVGGLLQFELAWQDIFGDRILSDLSEPQTSSSKPLNQPPQIVGYTDRLIGVGQWPAVANAFRITPNAQSEPSLELLLVFDQSQYDAAIASGDPDGEQKIKHALSIYAQILYQLGDPNGIIITLTTSVTPSAGSLLSAENKQALVAWVESIYIWLKSLLPAESATAAPTFQPEFTLAVNLDAAKINTDQIFLVSASLTISRHPALVDGELSTAPGVTEASTAIAPWTGPLSDAETTTDAHRRFMAAAQASDATTDIQRGIEAFAKAFTTAFAKITGVSYNIATGSDRNAFTGGNLGALWAVQLGLAKGQPISYEVVNKGQPKIFAPRPVSNKLTSRPKTSIIGYQTGKVISPTDPAVDQSFTSIDLDQWMLYTLTQIDALLTPKYVAPAQILRQQTGVDSLQKVLDAKKNLAGALKAAMIPVFKDETASTEEKQAIQEVFYQTMLGLLGQFYAVKTGIQFEANVNSAIPKQANVTDPPRLYGNIVENEPKIQGAEIAASDPVNQPNVSLSSPKLELKFAGDPVAARYLSFLLSSTSDRASIPLNLEYSGQYIEHEIGKLNGIQGYQPSSWLSFADNTTTDSWPLRSDLGQFDAPIVLRAFPATPTLVNQERVANLASPCYVKATPMRVGVATMQLQLGESSCPKQGTYNPLADIALWNYGFEYAQQVHFLQDAVHGEITFNISSPGLTANALALPQRDLFDNLAEFVRVYPRILADLDLYLAPLDITTTGTPLTNAQAALESTAVLIQWIADTATVFGSSLEMSAMESTTQVPSYPFTISEAEVDKTNPDGSSVKALQVTVALTEAPPARVGSPLVQIEPETYNCQLDGGDDKTFRFVYVNKVTGNYLSADAGRIIPGRTFALPDMDILERQDAQTSIYLTRNEDLAGKEVADVFVYTTPLVSFPEPLHPTLDSEEPIDLATIYAKDKNDPVKRSLSCQLTLLYEALFEHAGTDSVTLEMGVYYEYSINSDVQKIRLPVYLMPPTRTAIREGGIGTKLDDVIAAQVKGWETWFQNYKPMTTLGSVSFDLTIMSNLTERPMPLLRLPGLYLSLLNIEM